MHLVRGRAATVDDDRAATAAMLSRTAETGIEAFRAWTPHRQVAFGRRDTHAAGYETACRAARERDYAVVERRVGGRAVAYSGSTVAFAHAVPLADPRQGLTDRYEAGTDGVVVALRGLDVDARPGEPAASFCPGDHSVQIDGRKVAGIAQRVGSDAALVAGCVLVSDRADLVGVLTPVYGALDVPFDPESVGTVAGAGDGGPRSRPVCRALERAFVGDETDDRVRVESVDELAAHAASPTDAD